MLNFTNQKDYTPQNKFTTCYNFLEKVGSLLIKITFPLWVIPFLSIILILKIANFWKHVGTIVMKMVYPNTPPQLVYAILKGNGKYLREQHETIFTRQFYDYTSRKLMSISQLENESIIVELQCDNEIGVNYLAQCVKPQNVKGLLSDLKLVKSVNWPHKYLKKTTYITQGHPEQVDCFLLFNFKSKINFLGKSSMDLVKILEYCRYHMNQQGFIVYGDYFQAGQMKTFEKLFNGFGFIIVQQEDISKNINYAKKLLCKDRNHLQVKLVNFFKEICFEIVGKKSCQCGTSFYVIILQKKVICNSQ